MKIRILNGILEMFKLMKIIFNFYQLIKNHKSITYGIKYEKKQNPESCKT